MPGCMPEANEILFASANASVHFALACLEPVAVSERLRARSSFVDPDGAVMHWHDFGDLEGPGWAANAVGGAHLLYRWGQYLGHAAVRRQSLRLLDHILEDGFVRDDGFVWPYWHLAEKRFCLNYARRSDWLCPGSLALVGVQMLEFATDLGARSPYAARLQQAAERLSGWLAEHTPLLASGWTPRRITMAGEPYLFSPHSAPHGAPDPIFDHSADGLFLLALWAMTGRFDLARTLGDAFVAAGGLWGSINHDTFDDHENVAYAVAFRVLRRAAALLDRPAWRDFVAQVALPSMARFRMDEDRNGVVTRGLFWMEASWDTAYLWENAEVAQAHLAAWMETGDARCRDVALGALSAMAHHHYGAGGFLSEGIDWNDHVGQEHHIRRAPYGAIQYTEPLLNNLHLVGPTLTWFERIGFAPPAGLIDARASIEAVCALSNADCRTLVRG